MCKGGVGEFLISLEKIDASWCSLFILQVEKSFLQNEGGYRDGLKHQKGRNKGSLHSKDTQSYMTPSIIISLFDVICNRTKI